jgi:hypothetical protein
MVKWYQHICGVCFLLMKTGAIENSEDIMTPEQIERVLTNTDQWLADYTAADRDSVLGDKTVSQDLLHVVVRAFTKVMAEDYDRAPRRWTAREAGTILTAHAREWSEALNLTGTELAAVLGDYVEFLESEHHIRSAKAIATALIKAGVGSEATDQEPVDRTRVDAVIKILRALFSVPASVSDKDMLKQRLPEAILLGADLTFTELALLAQTASDDDKFTVKGWLQQVVLPLFNLTRVKELLEEQLGEKLTDEAVSNYELTSLRASDTAVVSDQRLAVAASVAGMPLVTGSQDEVAALVARFPEVMATVPDLSKFIAQPKPAKKKRDLKHGLSMKAAKKLRSKKNKRK